MQVLCNNYKELYYSVNTLNNSRVYKISYHCYSEITRNDIQIFTCSVYVYKIEFYNNIVDVYYYPNNITLEAFNFKYCIITLKEIPFSMDNEIQKYIYQKEIIMWCSYKNLHMYNLNKRDLKFFFIRYFEIDNEMYDKIISEYDNIIVY